MSILIGLSIACGRPATEEQPGAQVEPLAPNIVFIMADDLGYADLSSYGRTDYSTPALDRLASEGTRFTQAYAISLVCTPTRVGLMTGQYPARHRIGLFEPLRAPFEGEGLDATAPTLSTRLSDAGYHTGLVGKWHLGRESEFRPSAYGFDSWFAILSGGADYVSHRVSQPLIPSGPHDLYQDDEETFADGYLTDLFTEQAEAFLRATDEPFFLNLEYSAPHWPWQQPGDPPIPEDANPVTYGGSPEIYAGMMGALDTGVARMMAVLDELGYAQRTIVIFTSDNGGERFSDMGDLIGAKRQLWEGGVRVPAFVRWPGVVPAGVTTDQVASTLDWTATMLAAGGVDVSADLDGIDLLPHLRGEIPTMERTVFWRSTRWVYNTLFDKAAGSTSGSMKRPPPRDRSSARASSFSILTKIQARQRTVPMSNRTSWRNSDDFMTNGMQGCSHRLNHWQQLLHESSENTRPASCLARLIALEETRA